MEVVAIVGKTGTRAYLVGCVQSRQAVLIGPLAEDRKAYREALKRRGWSLLAELTFGAAPTNPLLAPVRVVARPHDGASIEVTAGKRATRVPLYVTEATLAPDPPPQVLVTRVGQHKVHAIACVADPAEVCWRIDNSVFTERMLFSPGTWPAAATPGAVLALPPTTVVYPRRAQDGHNISTVSMERVWLERWQARGYRPEIPDPTATVRSAPDRRGP